MGHVSLRGRPVEQIATLPDGREAVVRIAVPEDPYIPRRELTTVALELTVDGRVQATLNTVLGVEQESEALELAREIVGGLESGGLQPTAGSLEPLVDVLR